jgi:hypothetical protein
MTVSDEYRVKAADFRAQAEREKDPLFRSMFWTMSRTYSRLARHHEQYVGNKLAYERSPPIAGDD